MKFSASVLHLRGSEIARQPMISESGDVLLWNGEIFDGVKVEEKESDTSVLFTKLIKLSSNDEIYSTFEQIEGPFAFVFFSKNLQTVFYGRDRFGRRSLLEKQSRNEIIIASVASSLEDWNEISANQIFSIKLSADKFEIQSSNFRDYKKYRINTMLTGSDEYLFNYEEKAIKILESSVRRRVMNVPNNINSKPSLGILFSGGLDSMVLTVLMDRILPEEQPVELINVAFENPRFIKNLKNKTEVYNVPDRLTGIDSFHNLKKISKREWRFIRVDVSKEEMDKELNHVKQLIYPSDTVMDLSIGIALWFASKGNGQLLQGGDYHSEAKVLIVGMGADEQLAGYSRHRVKFEMEGLSGLLNEIQLDLDRISIRNLGRDDRVISDNGKEARFPFLDEQVVEFFSSLPISVKCDLSLPRGFGEKKLLRSLARHLKIESAASLPKRAIQFGSKTAKIFSSKESGSDSLFS